MKSAIEACQYPRGLGLGSHGFGVVTLHRPSNVDDAKRLAELVPVILAAAQKLPVVFPVHPRTRQRLQASGVLKPLAQAAGVTRTVPLGCTGFMRLVF